MSVPLKKYTVEYTDKVPSRSSVVSLQLLLATTSCCVLDGVSSIEILVLEGSKKYTVEYTTYT